MLFKRDHNNRHGAVRQNSNSRSRGVPSILSDGFKSEGDIISDGEVHILGAHSGNLVAHKLTLGEGGSITGTVSTPLRLVKSVSAGQSYTFSEADLVDWVITKPDGSEEGNLVGKFLDTYKP
jgi:hypothetical protein